jgi:hypothetical protein
MTDQPIRIDREKALHNAEAALVAHRLYQQRRIEAVTQWRTSEDLEQWRREFPPTLSTETTVVVDATIASGTTDPLALSQEEAILVAWALRQVRGWPEGSDALDHVRRSDALRQRLLDGLA